MKNNTRDQGLLAQTQFTVLVPLNFILNVILSLKIVQRSRAKEYGWPLQAGKGQEMDYLPRVSKRNVALLTPFSLSPHPKCILISQES